MTSGLLTSGWAAALLNHLWQSTAVALLAWLLTLALRDNSARVRYAIWLSASVKFLLPFQLLTYLGARWSKPTMTNGAQFYSVVEEITRPLRQAPIAPAQAVSSAGPTHSLPVMWTVVVVVWLCGFAVLLLKWILGWKSASRMAAAGEPITSGREFDALLRACSNVQIQSPIRLLLSPAGMEPGIFGIARPVLLWPDGLSDRLDDAQIEVIIAHEIEHVRRYDNLTSAIHSLVEGLFWFHPLVSWMSTRLSEERERACDERVIEENARPEAYAESILKVCAFCTEPAAACVSGVSGADLKQRILRIMTQRPGTALGIVRKCLLSSIALLLVAAPVGFGALHGQSAAASVNGSTQGYSWTPDLPKFDVATIKPTSEDAGGLMIRILPDGISLRGVPPQMLLQTGLGVESDRIVDAPDWVRSKRFDVEAKVAPEDAPKLRAIKMEQRNAMLLPVLEERFHLKYHHETRELPTYALVVAKGGSKLAESKPGEPMSFPDGHSAGAPPGSGGPGPIGKSDGLPRVGNRAAIGEGMRMSPGGIQSRGGNIAFLAHALSRMLGRTVVDKTGLTGNYDFSLNWTPDEGMTNPFGGPQAGAPRDDAPPDANGPSLFTALEQQLGLKLQSEKGKVDVIVIDHIDLPTEN